jgi:hypothetical protein
MGTDTGGEVEGPTHIIDGKSSIPCSVQAVVTGTINYSLQGTMRNVQDLSSTDAIQWTTITAYSGKTADVMDVLPIGITAIRAITASYSSGAELQLNVNHVHD